MSQLASLRFQVPDLAAAADAFDRLGFELDAGGTRLAIGPVSLDLVEAEPAGVTAWTFLGDADAEVRLAPAVSLPTSTRSVADDPSPAEHPNTTVRVDHIVAMVPGLDAAVAGLETFVGCSVRRRGQVSGLPAAFVRAGDTILEMIEMRTQERPSIWGISVEVADLDKAIRVIRDRDGEVTDATAAIQGGRIATAPADACFGLSFAFMEPAAR